MTTQKPILIADDNPSSLRLLQVILEDRGYEVLTAKDGQEAWDLFNTHGVSIALLDWVMPGMTGVEVCRKIRSGNNKSYTYIILVTARDSKEDLVTAMDAGADDYVNKPYHEEELHSRIKAGERIVGLEKNLAGKIEELQKAFTEVKQLKGLIPICMYCKKIRDDRDYWHILEKFIHEHTGADFSHGICPQCMEKYVRPQIDEIPPKNNKSQ